MLNLFGSNAPIQALTRLTRLAQRNEKNRSLLEQALGESRLAGLVDAALQVGVETGDPIGQVLADRLAETSNTDLALQIMGLCLRPEYQGSVPLREVALVATQRIREAFPQVMEGEPEESRWTGLAELAHNLSLYLNGVGRHEEALQASLEAVELNRRLAQRHPQTAREGLARSLDRLGLQSGLLEQPERGMEALHEAIGIYRGLAEEGADVDRPLAQSLGHLSFLLRNLERREEALQVGQEAHALYVQLARKAPSTASYADLARSLDNLGFAFAQLDQLAESLACVQEAVEVRRQLADQRPDVYQDELAQSLQTLSRTLRKLGRPEEALEASREAVVPLRKLAEARPAAFEDTLAAGLNQLGIQLTDRGSLEEARAVFQESADLRRKIAAELPGTGESQLAKALSNLGKVLGDLGRREKALAAVQESVALRRELTRAQPDVNRLELANGLHALAILLDESGRSEEALAAARETLEIRRDLARLRPGFLEPDLAATLCNLSVFLGTLGRHEEAVPPLREAIEIYRPLVRKLGRTEEALAAVEEAVAIWRELASWRPVFHSRLAAGLDNLGETLTALGRSDWAVEVLREAVEIGRRLDQEQPGLHRDVLALSLHHLSLGLREMGDLREALVRSEEAIRLLLPLAEACPEAHGDLLAEMRQEYRKTATVAGVEPDPEWLPSVTPA
jgi:tetratricopeptide (TPR) repeat protein